MTNQTRRRFLTRAGALGSLAVVGSRPSVSWGRSPTPATRASALASLSAVPRALRASGWPCHRLFSRAHQSTSEGQSYGMVFALIAGDRNTFDRLWRWSVTNLGDGRLDDKLPAWQWGHRDDGTWGVMDRNPAADADLWFAFALAEAARLWNIPALCLRSTRFAALGGIAGDRLPARLRTHAAAWPTRI
ncbi:glycosyl hydrolase family 8 [Cupriavidus basilensis]